MAKSTPATPIIEKLKLSTMIVDFTLAGRQEKEVKENAKELAPMLANGWSPSQPGEYFKRGNENHLAAGFTRSAASLLNGHDFGYFVEVPDVATELRTTAIRTNASKPISAFEQGRIYAAMRDGTDTSDLQVGGVVLPPMKTSDIATEVGKTRQHVDNCIAVFENPPEIAELITSGAISAPVVVKAKQLVKDEKKLIKFCKAICKLAEADGKATATMKHLDAARPDFAPVKAAKSAPAAAETPAPASSAPASEEKPSASNDTPQSSGKSRSEPPASESAPADTSAPVPSTPEVPQADAQPELFNEPAPAPAPKSKKFNPDKVRGELTFLIEKWGEDTAVSWSDSDLDQLLDALVDYAAKAASPF